jgi:type IV secretory pathway TraG/TraD family ATPase VirD4
VLQSVENSEVLAFWNDEFPKMNYKNAIDGVAPIANKLGAFLSNPIVKKTLCSPDKPLRFRQIMDEGTPLVINLSKGQLGADISGVLGGLIMSMMANAAFTRDTLPVHRRRPYIIYADEFASFTTGTIAGMLSELRKYRVGLVLAAQYCSQIKTTILDAVLGNAGTFIVFRLGAQDAPLMSRQLGEVHPADIVNLPNFRMFIKLMVNGVQTKAFSAITLRSVV